MIFQSEQHPLIKINNTRIPRGDWYVTVNGHYFCCAAHNDAPEKVLAWLDTEMAKALQAEAAGKRLTGERKHMIRCLRREAGSDV